jgi:hypothetical protein
MHIDVVNMDMLNTYSSVIFEVFYYPSRVFKPIHRIEAVDEFMTNASLPCPVGMSSRYFSRMLKGRADGKYKLIIW